jgi:hypothetical protein
MTRARRPCYGAFGGALPDPQGKFALTTTDFGDYFEIFSDFPFYFCVLSSDF